MEISKSKIRMLKILNDNIYKMSLNVLDIKNLSNFERKFDLVFTDAVLIYVNHSNISKLLKNLIKSSKKKFYCMNCLICMKKVRSIICIFMIIKI